MRRLSLLVLSVLVYGLLLAQTPNVKLISWNLCELGRSKSADEIDLIAQVLRGYDVIAIQEVVAKDPAGAQAVARLADALDRTGDDYDYRVSHPTRSSSPPTRERYAFLWKTATVQLVGRPRLLSAYAKTVEREPYLAEFSWRGRHFRVANLHTRPHDAQPEGEVAALRNLPDEYADLPFFLLGDFNLVSRHTVFHPWLSRGYRLAAENQKTTLRRRVRRGEDAYSRENDNILVPAHQVQLLEGGTLDVLAFMRGDLAAARALSDHVPVYAVLGSL